MKILMISHPHSIHTKNWVEGLTQKGVDVTVLHVKGWSVHEEIMDIDLGVEVILLEPKTISQVLQKSLRTRKFTDILRDFRYRTKLHQELNILGKELSNIIQEGGYEYVHAHGVATGALLAGFSNFRPFGVSAWGSDIYITPEKYPYLKRLYRQVLPRANIFHVESEISAARVMDLIGIDKSRLMISTWGVDVEQYTDDTESLLDIGGFDLSDKRIILSFRALEPLYQTDKIIEAYSDIFSDFPDTVLVIGSNGSERSNLQQLVEKLGMSDRVIFTGYVYDNQKKALLKSAYLFIQSPLSDGVSITVMEAMASGLPIITSNAGENKVLVEQGKNGFLVDAPYEKNLSPMMRRLLQDTQLHDEMAMQSRKIVAEKHNRSVFLDRFLQRVKEEISKERV